MDVFVVDDHRMFGDSVRFLIERRYPFVSFRQVTDAEKALAALKTEADPDIILLDLKLPGASGRNLLQRLNEENVRVPILVVSASRSISDAEYALRNGAMGFVSKEASGDELLDAVEAVVRGETYDYFQRRGNDDSGPAEKANVTPRQQEVLRMLSEGYSNKLIARELGISEHTVKAHLHDIYRVLRVKNRTACVKEAERLGLF